jgi:hypothetical protein
MKFTYTEKKDTRSGFGAGLAELADKNPNVVALCRPYRLSEDGKIHRESSGKILPDRYCRS